MGWQLVTPPAEEPVSLAEAKLHLRVDIADDDALIGALIMAAREWCEDFRRQRFVTQTWDLFLDSWPVHGGRVIDLPYGPVQSVASVTAIGADGSETVLPSSDYVVDAVSEPARLALMPGASWPAVALRPVNGVAVRYTVGYGAAADVPETAKAAIKLLVGGLYENREDEVIGQGGVTALALQMGARSLLRPQRVYRFID